MPKIYIMKGPEKGRSFELKGDMTTIGRGVDADIRLSDKTVSKRHTQIMQRGNKYVLKDLGSKNGTFLDGKRIIADTLHEIREGVSVAIGGTSFSLGKPFAQKVMDELDSIDLFKAPNGKE